MRKLALTLICVLAFAAAASAQKTAFGIYGQPASNGSGWEHVVTLGTGISIEEEYDMPPLNLTYTFQYGFDSNLYAGASVGSIILDEEDMYYEARIMATGGWSLPIGNNALFFQANSGLAICDYEELSSTYDLLVGFRFNFSNGMGMNISSGISGTYDWWLAVPINLSIVF